MAGDGAPRAAQRLRPTAGWGVGLCGRSLHFGLRKRRPALPSIPPALPVALPWRRLRTQTGSDSVDLASCQETRLSKFRETAFVQGLVSGLAAVRGSLLTFSLPFPESGSGTAPPGSCTWRPWSGTTAVCAAWDPVGTAQPGCACMKAGGALRQAGPATTRAWQGLPGVVTENPGSRRLLERTWKEEGSNGLVLNFSNRKDQV